MSSQTEAAALRGHPLAMAGGALALDLRGPLKRRLIAANSD